MNPARLPPDHPDAPKFWMHESSGVLEPVVIAYLHDEELDVAQVKLMKAYLWQWVKSPVWGPSGTLETLRLRVAAIETYEDLGQAIHLATELGMDPL